VRPPGREVADSCLQYWGGMGYTGTTPSRAPTATAASSIGGGADEVMLGIICKLEGTLPPALRAGGGGRHQGLLARARLHSAASLVAPAAEAFAAAVLGPEGQEGTLAFVQKRPPAWVPAA
jgi:hypothetical protein